MSHTLTGSVDSHRRRVLSRHSVTMHEDPIQVGEAACDPSAVACDITREAGVIRTIRLRCPCGQVIVLDCEYATHDDALAPNTEDSP